MISTTAPENSCTRECLPSHRRDPGDVHKQGTLAGDEASSALMSAAVCSLRLSYTAPTGSSPRVVSHRSAWFHPTRLNLGIAFQNLGVPIDTSSPCTPSCH